LKVMHGSALPGSADDRDLVSIQPIGEEGELPLQIPRSVMTRIIRARIDETLELLRDRLNKSGYGNAVGKRAFSTPVGLLIYPQMASFESHSAKGLSGFRMTGTGGKLHRMSQWLRDSF
ncbi:MAG: cell division protein FtsA, partial [Mesorhizobium sp.]